MKRSIFPSFGIAERLTLVATFVVALSFITIGGFIVNRLQNQMKDRLKIEASDALLIAQKTLAQPMWTFDKSAIASTTEGLLQSNQGMLKLIRIYGHDEKVIHEKYASTVANATNADKYLSGPNFYEATTDIEFEKQKIGSVKVVLSSEKLEEELNTLINQTIYLVFISMILVSVALLVLIRYYISKPVSGLVLIAKQIESAQELSQNSDWILEFGVIAKAFFQAAETIRKRDLSLRNYNEKLEAEILQRTQKIDEQRMTMIASSRMASLGEMSAGIAHEINNPLTVIGGKIMLIKRKMTANPELQAYSEDILKIQSMVTRISKIIEGLRSFGRDGSRDDKNNFLISKVITDLKDLCHARLVNHGVTLTIEMSQPDLKLFGREVQFSQVLINLVNNASDAIQNNKEKWVKIKVTHENNATLIRVTDSGSGIPIDVQAKIMQPFFTTKDIGKGTGLGLSISLGIIKDHGGTLTYSEDDGHTSFLVTMPDVSAILKTA